jgi:hypothetical protein
MVKEASCQKKEDCFFSSDKDIRKDVKAQQRALRNTSRDYGNAMKHVRGHWNQSFSLGNKSVGGQ